MWGEKIKKSLTVFLLMIGLSSYILPQKNIVFAQDCPDDQIVKQCFGVYDTAFYPEKLPTEIKNFFDREIGDDKSPCFIEEISNSNNIDRCFDKAANYVLIAKNSCSLLPQDCRLTENQNKAIRSAFGAYYNSLLPQIPTVLPRVTVPTGLPSIITPSTLSIPTSTPVTEIEIEIQTQTHLSSCGLKSAQYQCCFPNVKTKTDPPLPEVLSPLKDIYNASTGFLKNIVDDMNFFNSDLQSAVYNGSNQPPDLCPRTEDGFRLARFYTTSSPDKWLDQSDMYSISEEATKNSYLDLIYGATNPDDGLRNYTSGLVGKILNTEALPLLKNENGGLGGISMNGDIDYGSDNSYYNCVCFDPTRDGDKTPKNFIELNMNTEAIVNESADIISFSRDKHCRNIKSLDEKAECMSCVLGTRVAWDDAKKDWEIHNGIGGNLGGAWTALGCIQADFSSTLENQLFPLFIGLGGLISLGCIIYASFLLQTSMGEPEKIGKAQELMTSCITGLIMIIFSIFILRVIGFDILRLPGFGDEASSQDTDSSINTLPTPTTGQGLMVDSPTQPSSQADSTPVPPTIIENINCTGQNNLNPNSNQIFIYDDEDAGGACAILTKYNQEDTFNLSKISHDTMTEALFYKCNDNFEDCIASFKLGSGVEVELYKESGCTGDPLIHNNGGLTNIDSIDNSLWPFGYTDSVSCIKLKNRSQ